MNDLPPGETDELMLDDEGLPWVMPLLGLTIRDLMKHAGQWVIAGIPMGLVLTVALVVIFVITFFVTIAGLQLKNIGLLVGGVVGTSFVGFFTLWLVLTPLEGALDRAVLAWVRDGVPPAGLRTAFAGLFRDLPTLLVVQAAQYVFIVGGLLFGVIPGLIAMVILELALPAVIVDGLGPIAAIRRSAAHAWRHPLWRIGLSMLTFLLSNLGTQVPIIGVGVATIVIAALRIRAYRLIWPSPNP